MRLQDLGQSDRVEVVEAIDRIAKSFVVLFFDQKTIVSLVDSFEVQLNTS